MNKKKYISYFYLIIIFSTVSIAFNDSSLIENNHIIESADDDTLTIVTRHDLTITDEFKDRFLATSEAQALNITDIDFRQATTDAGWKTLLENSSYSVDLAWGGGPDLFDKMISLDLLYPINPVNNSELYSVIDESVPATLVSVPMKRFSDSGDLLWVANTISSYGITVNHDFLETHDLPVPVNWSDLANPVYYISPSVTTLAMGDPPLTTSHTRIYQFILQAFGWDEGWSLLTRMAGNADVYPGSVQVDVAIRQEAAGIALTIDFYGIVANRENPSCEYIIPEDYSLIMGDPIALAANVDDYDAAVAFIKYVVSPEGQAAWMTPGLDRLPVNASAFDTPEGSTYTYMQTLYTNTIQKQGFAFNLTLATSNLDTTIYYFHNTITQQLTLLRNTWGEIATRFKNGLLSNDCFLNITDQLGVPGMTLQESIDWNEQYTTDAHFAATKDSEWRTFAISKYNRLYFFDDGFCDITPTPTTSTNWLISIVTLIVIPILATKRRKNRWF
jgi:ABC-type Fe3+ transport system substrate-binding protein